MQQWEYLDVSFIWDDRASQWFVQQTDDSTRVGLRQMLNDYGSRGWELIGLVASRWRNGPFRVPTLAVGPFETAETHDGGDAIVYLGVFKRPKQEG